MRHADNHTGGQRQLQVHRSEHALERGDDEDEQHGDSNEGYAEDDGRIYHRSLDLPDERVALLEEGGKAEQNRIENTTGFARCDHVDVEAAEGTGVLGEGVGERIAGLDVVHDRLRYLLEQLVFGLVRQNREGLY